MKAVVGIILAALLVFSIYNGIQVQELRQEVGLLKAKLAEEQSSGMTDELLAEATRALAGARDALGRANIAAAREGLSATLQKLQQAGATVSEKSRPVVKWLEEQTAQLSRQLDRGERTPK